ncbi:MAG: glycosyltransferase family 4 protein [Terracidiphilus sp.]
MSLTGSETVNRDPRAVRVALLTNYLNPHRLHLVELVANQFSRIRIFLSGLEDKEHGFSPSWKDLDVNVQRSLHWTHRFRNVNGYQDASEIHFPYDVLFELCHFHPDVVLSGELGGRTIQSCIYRILFPGTKLIAWTALSQHTEATRDWLRRTMRSWIVRHIDAAFVNGKSGEAYVRSLGFDGPVFTVPYAIEEAPFSSQDYMPTRTTRRMLYTGQLIPRKGVHRFCTVLNRWCEDHPDIRVHFKIIGGGPERKLLRFFQPTASLTLTLLPRLAQKDLATHYREADLYAFPTLGDEWGVVVNEAMLAGLPVLGSIYSQAVAELVEEGQAGWTFSPNDDESTYKAIGRALTTSVESLKAISAHARTVIAQISPAIVAKEVVRAIGAVSRRFPADIAGLATNRGNAFLAHE